MALEVNLTQMPKEDWDLLFYTAHNEHESIQTHLRRVYGATWKIGSNEVYIFLNKEKYAEFILTWL